MARVEPKELGTVLPMTRVEISLLARHGAGSGVPCQAARSACSPAVLSGDDVIDSEFVPALTVSSEPPSPPVPSLLGPGGPFAVLGRVAFIVVYALKRVFGGGFISHVVVEHLEAVPPSGVYGDSTSSVVVEPSDVGVGAAGNHVTPGLIFGRRASSASAAMREPESERPLLVETPATLSVSSAQIVGGCNEYVAAIAQTFPSRPLPVVVAHPVASAFYDNQPGEPNIGQVKSFHSMYRGGLNEC